MITTLFAFLATNKYLVAAVGLFVAAGAVYLKGYKAGGNSVREENEKAREELAKRLLEIAAENQQIDKKREQNAENVDRINDVDTLIKLFDEHQKTPRD